MKWTIEEYESQPSWFVDYLLSMINQEAAAGARAADRIKKQ